MRRTAHAALVVLAAAAAVADDDAPAAPPKCTRWDTKADITALAASGDGSTVAIGTRDGAIRLLPTDGSKPVTIDAVTGTVARVGFSPNGKLVWATPPVEPSLSTSTTVAAFRAATGTRTQTIELSGEGVAPKAGASPLDGALTGVVPLTGDRVVLVRLWAPRVGADGKFIDHPPEVVDLRTGERSTETAPPHSKVLAVSPDGSLVAFGTLDGLVIAKRGESAPVWSAKDGERETWTAAALRFVRCDDARFSTDGKFVVARTRRSSEESGARSFPVFETFDAATGEFVISFRCPSDQYVVGKDFVACMAETGKPVGFAFNTSAERPVRLPSDDEAVAICATHDGSALWVATRKGVVLRVVPTAPTAKK